MPYTPLPAGDLVPYTGQASNESTHLYQQKTGSVIYPSVITRPDTAFAASKLAQFMANPGPDHHTAMDHLLQYLYGTRYLALEFDGHSTAELLVASDTSFADDLEDRKS